jgi:hypothetical protein
METVLSRDKLSYIEGIELGYKNPVFRTSRRRYNGAYGVKLERERFLDYVPPDDNSPSCGGQEGFHRR